MAVGDTVTIRAYDGSTVGNARPLEVVGSVAPILCATIVLGTAESGSPYPFNPRQFARIDGAIVQSIDTDNEDIGAPYVLVTGTADGTPIITIDSGTGVTMASGITFYVVAWGVPKS